MKEEFKAFVKKNPSLVKYVNNDEMTWQKFYEMYDMYGEDSSVWSKYITPEEVRDVTKTTAFADLLSFLKTINLDNLQEGINNIQKVVGVFQDFSSKKSSKSEYKPRPLYKHFED